MQKTPLSSRERRVLKGSQATAGLWLMQKQALVSLGGETQRRERFLPLPNLHAGQSLNLELLPTGSLVCGSFIITRKWNPLGKIQAQCLLKGKVDDRAGSPALQESLVQLWNRHNYAAPTALAEPGRQFNEPFLELQPLKAFGCEKQQAGKFQAEDKAGCVRPRGHLD